MNGEQITNQIWLEQMVDRLETARKEGIGLVKAVIGQALYFEDLYYVSIIDKCLRLIDGFINMLKQRNLTCAGILLRVQIDNCFRTFAVFAAADKNEVVKSIMDGELQLNKLKSKDGSRMTDQYLKQQLEKLDKRFGSVYKESSGYIHHSEKALYTIASIKEPSCIELSIGNQLPEKFNQVFQECAEAFLFFVEFQYALTQPIVDSKLRIDFGNNVD